MNQGVKNFQEYLFSRMKQAIDEGNTVPPSALLFVRLEDEEGKPQHEIFTVILEPQSEWKERFRKEVIEMNAEYLIILLDINMTVYAVDDKDNVEMGSTVNTSEALMSVLVNNQGEVNNLLAPYTRKGDKIMWKVVNEHIEPTQLYNGYIPHEWVQPPGQEVFQEIREKMALLRSPTEGTLQ